jgi:hypothetical protein
MKITSRMPRAEYDAIDALNISRLKNIKRSPQHYRHALDNREQKACLTLGNATHVAVLEPERYLQEFAVWTRRTEAGKAAPRNGQHWEKFQLENPGRTILTYDENSLASDIAAAVRSNELAMPYLASGDPEVTLEWALDAALGGRAAKSRVDWLTNVDGQVYLVGLKTARDCRRFAFGSQAAKLSYHWQWAYYFDAYKAIRGKAPRMVEIVVESEAPHAVAVYKIPDDIIEQGREEYWEAVKRLAECEVTLEWPGPEPTEEFLSLPTWVYGTDDDDINELGLTKENAA